MSDEGRHTGNQSAAIGSHDAALLGSILGGCRIERHLGNGAVGAVYRAEQIDIGRTVAVKVIRPGLCYDENRLQRFRHEARTVGQFTSPHVVQVYHVGQEDDLLFLVMEYVAGGTLRSCMERRPLKRLDLAEVTRFLRQCCDGLKEAELLRVLHRDIKPDNLLVDRLETVKITDFGLAKVLGDDAARTMTSGLLGTPLYMSPEQGRYEELDLRSDVYSLGASFFHLMTGRPPVEGHTVSEVLFNKIQQPCLSPQKVVPDLPGQLCRVIEKMTALDRSDRYRSYHEIVDELDRIEPDSVTTTAGTPGGRPPAVAHGGAAAAPPNARRRVRVSVAGLVGIAIALAATGVVWLPRPTWLGDAPGAGAPPDPPTSDLGQPRAAPDRPPAPPSARQQPIAETVDPDADAAARAAELQRELRNATSELRAEFVLAGPVEMVVDRIHALLLRTTTAGEVTATEAAEVAELARDVDVAVERSRRLKSHADRLPLGPPFTGLQQHVLRLREVLDAPENAGEALRVWMRVELDRRTQKIQDEARSALRELWIQCRSAPPDAAVAAVELERFDAALSVLQRASLRLQAVFPELADDVATWVPPEQLAALRHATRGRLDGGDLRRRIDELHAQLVELERLSGWTAFSARVDTALPELRGAVATWSDEYGLDARPLHAALDASERTAGRWREIERHIASAIASFAERDLTATLTAVASIEQHHGEIVDARVVRAAADDARAAFRQLFEHVDLGAAQHDLQRARAALAQVPAADGAARYLQRCLARLQRLRDATADMAPVAAGIVTTVRDAAPVLVPGFFIDRHEASRRQFVEFLETMAALQDSPEAAAGRRDAVVAWLGSRSFAAALQRLPALRARLAGSVGTADLPIESVDYHQARAFVRWHGKELPTFHQWWLAARGPDDETTRWPWGASWSRMDQDRNARGRPTPVDRGGLARRFPPARSVHHLAGNVAEWLAEPRYGDVYELVGGSYHDEPRARVRKMRLSAGELLPPVPRTAGDDGFGFRGVLAVEPYFVDLAPK